MFQRSTVSNNHIKQTYMSTSTKIHQNLSSEKLENEIWKDIYKYEGLYQVSNLGRIKSLKRSKVRNDRVLKMSLCSGGYYRVNLKGKGKGKSVRVHTLVAEHFLNHNYKITKKVVDHINNNKLDNRVENLQIITQRENASKDKKGYSSKYVGVHITRLKNRWRACITIDSKQIDLGSFINEYDAHLAYQKKLKEVNNQ